MIVTDRDDEFLERALAGLLEPEEERTLAARLKAEPALARLLIERAREEALLAETLAQARAERALRREHLPRRSWRLAAAGLAAAALAAFLVWRSAPPASEGTGAAVVSAAGPASVRVGERVGPGRLLRTGPGGYAELRDEDGTRLLLGPETEILLARAAPAREVRLTAGVLDARVAPLPPGETFAFVTPHAEARVLGTVLRLVAEGASTRLEVEEGRVLFAHSEGGAPVEVRREQFAVAAPGRAPAPLPLWGTGLRGEYYERPDFTRLRAARVDPRVDLSTDAPAVRWSGKILPRASGTWAFHVLARGNVRLWVAGRLVLERPARPDPAETAGSIDLEGWRPADLRLEHSGPPGPVRLSWSGPSLSREVVPTAALFPAAGGSGLKAEYFDNADLTVLRVTRVDPQIDFAWGLGAPYPSIDPDYFSVRWSGFVEPAASGPHTFHVVSDDGARLWVDGKLLIDDWTVRGTRERTGTIELEAGRLYEIRLEYFECVSIAGVRLLWSWPGQPPDVIPQGRLYPDP
jgi:ferric-dicitrate binding protein FerR (iron transport regulator)